MRWWDGITDSMEMGLGRLVCCSSWGHKDSDTNERLNGTQLPGMVDLGWRYSLFLLILMVMRKE